MSRWIALGGIALLFAGVLWLLSALMRRTQGGSINPGQYGRGRYIDPGTIVRAKPKPPNARKHH